MGQTRMFRDRVVSMEQTLEGGEKHLPLLKDLCREALPGFEYAEHALDHERDLFVMELRGPDGSAKKIAWTRMVLFDAERIPTLTGDPAAVLRGKIVDFLKAHAARTEIVVTFRHLEEGWIDTPEPRREGGGRRRRRGGRGGRAGRRARAGTASRGSSFGGLRRRSPVGGPETPRRQVPDPRPRVPDRPRRAPDPRRQAPGLRQGPPLRDRSGPAVDRRCRRAEPAARPAPAKPLRKGPRASAAAGSAAVGVEVADPEAEGTRALPVRRIPAGAERRGRELRADRRSDADPRFRARVRRAPRLRREWRSAKEPARFRARSSRASPEMGILGMMVPEEYGGAGRRRAFLHLRHRRARAGLRVHGRDRLRQQLRRVLPDLEVRQRAPEDDDPSGARDRARRSGAYALTEPQSGSDAANQKTRAVAGRGAATSSTAPRPGSRTRARRSGTSSWP